MGVPSEKVNWAVQRICDDVERVGEIVENDPRSISIDDAQSLFNCLSEIMKILASTRRDDDG